MRALTIRQPWASLIAVGAKTIETRSWPTSYRGTLLIHAGKAKPANVWLRDDQDAPPAVDLYAMDPCWDWWEHDDPTSGGTYIWRGPLGAVVAVAELVDVVPIDRWATGCHVGDYPHDGPLPHQQGGLWLIGSNPITGGTPTRIEGQRPLGDFTPGRFAWLLDNVKQYANPVPWKGRQGLWTPDNDLIHALGDAGTILREARS